MNKSKTAGTHFNVRVVECRTAAQVTNFLFLTAFIAERFQTLLDILCTVYLPAVGIAIFLAMQ